MNASTRSTPRYAALLAAVLLAIGGIAPVAGQPAAQKLGNEFRVNTTTAFDQGNPSVGLDPAGNFVIVWRDTSSGTFTVTLQRFDSLGVPQGGETPLSPVDYPAVAMDGSGNFVVAWDSFSYAGSDFDISAQLFDADGNALSSEFVVNTYTPNWQRYGASVSRDQSGDFVIVWPSSTQDGSSWGVFGQRFDSSGLAQGGEFQINTVTSAAQYDAGVAMDADGDFVVVWTDASGQDGDSQGVFAQRFDADGLAQGAESQVNTFTTSYQALPAVDSDDAGNFVVTWSSPQDGSYSAVMAQRFDAGGEMQGGEFQVNTFVTGAQANSSVGVSPSGDFVVAWRGGLNQDGSGDGVFAQFFDASGRRVGGEFPVNSFTIGHQRKPRVGIDAAGNFTVAWESANQDGSGEGVFAQRFLAPCYEELALGQNQWHTIALPCEPPAGEDTVQDVFGDDLPAAGYGASWHVYRWNAAVPQYELLALTDTLALSEGYFIKTTLAGRTIDVEGNNADYSCSSATFSGTGGCYETAALTGAAGDCTDSDPSDGRFNLVGFPFRLQVNLAGVLLDDNGTERSMTAAEALNLVSDKAWTWNGAAYQVGDSCTLGMEKTFGTWDAVWLDVCDDDATSLALRLPARPLDFACSAPPPPIGPEEEGAVGAGEGEGGGGDAAWYLRLVATAGALSDPGNVLGELEDSVVGYDSHDLVELPPFGTDWLTVVFPHTDWGADSSEWYTSDYHGIEEQREWRFEVRSSQPRTVTLTWELHGKGRLIERLGRRLELVDRVSGKRIPAAAGSYTFTMDGTEHPLTWHQRRGGGHPH